jgi:DUF4097 and DUF4098 domain-containing protein YvlB
MKHLLFAFALAVAGTAAAHDDKAGGDVDRVNGGIHIDSHQTAGKLSTVNGGITIGEGAQVESVETVNGGIHMMDNAHASSLETVNGGVQIGAHAVVAKGAETVNGGIHLGTGADVTGAVSNVNGGIELDHAHVGGGIKTVSGDVTVGEGSTVDIGIKIEKPGASWFGDLFGKQRLPRVVIGANAVVNGPLTFERDVELYVHESAKIGSVSGATAKRYSGANPPPREN